MRYFLCVLIEGVLRRSLVLTAVVRVLVLFPVVAVGVCVLSFSRWMCWGLISFSFPVDVVGYVLFCAWRMGVVAGVFLSFSWALSCGGVWF